MDAVDNFVKKYNNKSVDFDGYYGAQCVDLFNFYNRDVIGASFIPTPITNGARDLWEHQSDPAKKHYSRVGRSEQPRKGDVIVKGEPYGRVRVNGKNVFYGHVEIYIGNNQIINQNSRNPGHVTVEPFIAHGVLGILRPKKFENQSSKSTASAGGSADAWRTVQAGDTFWGLEERLNLKHGTLQRLNPQLDPRRLSIGSKIRIREADGGENVNVKTYYIVKKGDTFWDLERAWQLQHGTLQQLNPELDARKLQIGQRIRRS